MISERITVDEVLERTAVTTPLGSVVGTSIWRVVMKIVTILFSALILASLAGAQTITVPQGTAVRLRLSQNVSSADAHVGDTVSLEVLDDVQAGAIRRGAVAHGVVTLAHEKRRMGRAGAVAIRVDYVAAADGSRVAVSAERTQKGSNSAGTISAGIVGSVIIFAPAAPLFLLKHGKDTDIPVGTPVDVTTTADAQVDLGQAPAPVHAPVKAAIVVAPQRVPEGPYTLAGGISGAGSASGDQTSLGDAARRLKAKKKAEVK
jgi:ribosomal protein L14